MGLSNTYPLADTQIRNACVILRPRLCENYFRKSNVVIPDSIGTVFTWWMGNLSQYQLDILWLVGEKFSSSQIIGVFTQPRPKVAAHVHDTGVRYGHLAAVEKWNLKVRFCGLIGSITIPKKFTKKYIWEVVLPHMWAVCRPPSYLGVLFILH